MSIKEAVYDFTVVTIAAAKVDDALYNADVHNTMHHPLAQRKTVRIHGMMNATLCPQRAANGSEFIEEANGDVVLFFCCVPAEQSPKMLVEAEVVAKAMADEWVLAALRGEGDLAGRVCNVSNPVGTNTVIMPQTNLIPVYQVRLRVNPE
ncbi:MAG TPA: hypothetical protein VGD05_14110 [Pyrinomonadaceae bacterium]|jgi:hypothetical protein